MFCLLLGNVGITETLEKISEDNPKGKESKVMLLVIVITIKNSPYGLQKSRPCVISGYPPVISQGWRKTPNYDRYAILRRNAKNDGRPRVVLLCLLGAVLRVAAPGNAPAEVLPVLLARCDLRGLLPGADWLRSRTPLQPQSAGWVCFRRKALHHQTREGLLKASEIALISRSSGSVGVTLSPGAKVAQTRNLAQLCVTLELLT